jgi:alpha-amylase/alpha-mannosidase (GH57 family)
MANNRYYLYCPKCKDQQFIGKSLGDGIYDNKSVKSGLLDPRDILKNMAENAKDNRALAKGGYPLTKNPEKYQSEFLGEIYDWMWKHIMECYKDEFYEGELFKVLTEYDKRINLTPHRKGRDK